LRSLHREKIILFGHSTGCQVFFCLRERWISSLTR
jgi:hypothetical protein